MRLHAFLILLAGTSTLTPAGPAVSESASDINAKIAQLKPGRATADDLIRIFGEPQKYIWGGRTFTKDKLPAIYIALYPKDFSVVVSTGSVHELRFQGPAAQYSYQGKIKIGCPLEQVIEVAGPPIETIEAKPCGWQDGILYKDIDGKKGYCYYLRNDQGVRFFFQDYRVAAIYLTARESGEGKGYSPGTVRPVRSVARFDDVRGKDMSKLDLTDRKNLISTLKFNQKTVWPESAKMPAGFDPNKVLADAMDPGLGVRELHARGVTGKGVNVAIIDQPLYQNHPEFAGRIAAYHDVGCHSESSMHGPAVASLLVGKNCGTAPEARLYHVAAPSWTLDTAYQAKALDWIVELNKKLPARENIRVVSVSAAPSGPGSPFKKNQRMWDAACARAEADGILVLDCTTHHGFIGPCWLDSSDRANPARCTPGFLGRPARRMPSDRVFVPTAPRTVAEQYDKDEHSHQYCGRGGLSWAIPYCAGVLALGWQVNPDMTPQQARQLLFDSAYKRRDGARIINPKQFIRLARPTSAPRRK